MVCVTRFHLEAALFGGLKVPYSGNVEGFFFYGLVVGKFVLILIFEGGSRLSHTQNSCMHMHTLLLLVNPLLEHSKCRGIIYDKYSLRTVSIMLVGLNDTSFTYQFLVW